MIFHSVTYESLVERIQVLLTEEGYQLLLDIVAVDNSRRENAHGVELIYLFLNMETHTRVAVKLSVNSNKLVPSLKSFFANASWLEKESWDMMGIKFSDSDHNSRLLNHKTFKGHLLLKDYKALKQSLNNKEQDLDNLFIVDSFHPAISGPLRLLYELDGENVKTCNAEIGYSHRGIEKLCEDRNFNQIIPLLERLNHHSATLNGVSWIKAVEEHLGIDITDRSKVLRMIFMELARITDHLLQLSRILSILNLKHKAATLDAMICSVSVLFKSYCGSGFLGNIARVGGLTKDIPMGWISECYQTVKAMGHEFDRFQSKLLNSRVWCERTRICILKTDDAIRYGCTGPCLRACGINYDLRKVSPYYFYRDLNFEVPLGLNGDAYDRNLVRMEEIRQSIRIIDQLLDNVPVGDVTGLLSVKGVDFDKVTQMKVGESYHSIESSNGELGYYLITDGSSVPYRLKIRPPSLALMQVYPKIAEGATLCDSLIGFMSMNIISGEMDR